MYQLSFDLSVDLSVDIKNMIMNLKHEIESMKFNGIFIMDLASGVYFVPKSHWNISRF